MIYWRYYKKAMDFQTPFPVCDYMVSLLPDYLGPRRFLEPTPGEGNIVAAIKKRWPAADVTAPAEFFDLVPSIFNGKQEYPRFDCVVMNPPFTPMIQGWKFLKHCMKMSNHIVCILPWFIPLNSSKRLKALQAFGLASITHLPRNTFPKSRIQCCVLELITQWPAKTIFKTFQF